MAEICPVCDKEIKAEDREEYKFSIESSPIPVHNFCIVKLVSKPEGYFEKLREELKIKKEKALKIEKERALKIEKERALKIEKEVETIDEKQTSIETNTTGSTSSKVRTNEVQVTSIDMPFDNMVFFMVKWAIASIPAFIILFLIGAILTGIFGSLFF